MSRVRVHNFSISLDGFATGEGQALETPFGHAGHRLHEWLLATRFARREILRESGGTEGVEEVERRTALHLQRRERTVGQDVGRGMERRVVAPPPAPLRVVLPARRAELAGAHDLRTDPWPVAFGHRVVETLGATRLAEHLTTGEASREHPLVEPMPGVTERRVEGQPDTGGVPVE